VVRGRITDWPALPTTPGVPVLMERQDPTEAAVLKSFQAWVNWQIGEGSEEEFNEAVDAVGDLIEEPPPD
jgi:hypothetical protein